MTIQVTRAAAAELPEIADIAARTFPLACPPSAAPANIAAFIEGNLSLARFRDYLADPQRTVLVSRKDGQIVGYALLIQGIAADSDVERAVTLRPAVELSKIYVSPESHGAGVSTALMAAAIEHARDLRAACVWLGVNQENLRARRFYEKHGFTIRGTKTFRLGLGIENDYVMVCSL
jgi:ribosomal protein S18 acetylase RimI-like enzyme